MSVKWISDAPKFGLVARRANHVTRGLKFGVLTPWPPGRREVSEVKSITNGQWFQQSWLRNEASIKTQNERVQSASRLGNQKSSTCHCAGPKVYQDRRTFVWDLTLRISSSGCWLVFFLMSFVISQQSSEQTGFLSSASLFRKLTKLQEGS